MEHHVPAWFPTHAALFTVASTELPPPRSPCSITPRLCAVPPPVSARSVRTTVDLPVSQSNFATPGRRKAAIALRRRRPVRARRHPAAPAPPLTERYCA